jgi:adenylate cyclase
VRSPEYLHMPMIPSTKTPLLRWLLPALIALTLIVLQFVALLSRINTPLERIELAARDLMMQVRGPQPTTGEIVIVAIDDQSFNWTGYQWPWPRTYMAQIVDKLNESGARVVGVDVFLFEVDPDPQGDPALAASLEQAQSAVTVMQIFRDPVQPGLITHKLPLATYRESVDGYGITAVIRDDDAIVRSLQAFDSDGIDTYYNWGFITAALFRESGPPAQPTPYGLILHGGTVPLQPYTGSTGRLLINFRGPARTFPTYSAFQVVLGDIPPETFKDKIVLIGATTQTLQDLYPTPFSASQQTPGVEIVANAIDTMLAGDYLLIAPPWVGLLLIVLFAIFSVLIVRIGRPSVILGVLLASMLAYGIACYISFNSGHFYLPLAGPETMLFLGVVLPTLEQAVTQELEKRRVRGLFTRFISPEMVDQLLTTQDVNSLNKRADLTILFSDIRGFTTLSEKLPPEEVVALLNPYLEAMTGVIHKHGGTVDKYEGDAIIAFYGEPVPFKDHALRAARTAVEMREVLIDLKERWAAEGRLPERFDIGIGLNSGEVFVGLLGSVQRINYTVIGDNVNLAARLQDLTKTYQWPIIVSEATYQQVKDEFEAEFADSVVVKGKTEPVRIYKLGAGKQ